MSRTAGFAVIELLVAGLLAVSLVLGSMLLVVVSVVAWAFGLAFVGIIALGYLAVQAAGAGIQRARTRTPVAPEPAPAMALGELHRVDIFQDLTFQQLEAVAALGRRTRVLRGTTLVAAPQASPVLYAICDGQAELHAGSPIGDLTVRVAGPGESFPLAALVGSGQVITSARAMTEMDVVAIPVGPLRDLCVVQPEIGRRIYARVAGVIAERYRVILGRLTAAAEESLRRTDFWANV